MRRSLTEGWIGAAEVKLLRAERDRYSLRILTVAKPSGAYLADVHVRIQDAQGHNVFDSGLDGPWLMIDLPVGHYSVQAERKGQTLRSSASISVGHARELVFRFPSSAGVESTAGAASGPPDGEPCTGAHSRGWAWFTAYREADGS
jgi:hypothetical protein